MKEKMLNIVKKIVNFCQKYYYLLILAIPFLLIDLSTKFFASKIEFYKGIHLVPTLFTVLWIFLFLGISVSFSRKSGKFIYTLFFVISFGAFLLNNVYYQMTNCFFDYSLIMLASEGSSYIIDTILNCNIWIYIIAIIILLLFILSLKFFPNRKVISRKSLLFVFIIFTLCHTIIPHFLGKPNSSLTWNTWRNPRNIYINFNDNNKSMMVSGFYEYNIRNFYITFLKPESAITDEELEFLKESYSQIDERKNNKYTGIFKDKNLIFLQLEGIDNWLITKEDTPNLYNMMNNSINFTNHFSYYNGGGSTFNSEFAVNTGFITPLSYTQNAYNFSRNSFPYSMAHIFKQQGYIVNAFHMNSSEYYSRGVNYKNWGYDNYYGLKDLGIYNDESYTLDRELILNKEFSEQMFNSDKFVDYIITYSTHLPFTTEKAVCKMLITEDILKKEQKEELPSDYVLPALTEEECVRRAAKETDDMVGLLLNELKERDLIDNTVIVVYADHYLYTLSDLSIIGRYKDINTNLINQTPFFIYDGGKTKSKVTKVTSQFNILPTVLNLYGVSYNSNSYIGSDALASNYSGYVFFSDYSWYDGNVYTEGGIVTNNKKINPDDLENKNYHINYLIRKNDLTLKYNYFKKDSNQ